MILVWLKALHLSAVALWCAGLVALPLILAKHRKGEEQTEYAELRRVSHYGYIRVVTPAAVVAVAAGTALIFLRGVFVPWLFAKLVLVGVLVAFHAVIGHTVILMSERRGDYTPPSAVPLLLLAGGTMVAVLVLVLAKPSAPDWTPDWLSAPRGRPLPVDETPI
ncbi:CopD family protein [Sphingomonas sp. ac-8]|uniref:CopD family protein n=1 Tax=Sphingomonas sp. ac-8 TaxID=3242977 RepID=UPI003A8125C3